MEEKIKEWLEKEAIHRGFTEDLKIDESTYKKENSIAIVKFKDGTDEGRLNFNLNAEIHEHDFISVDIF